MTLQITKLVKTQNTELVGLEVSFKTITIMSQRNMYNSCYDTGKRASLKGLKIKKILILTEILICIEILSEYMWYSVFPIVVEEYCLVYLNVSSKLGYAQHFTFT